MNNNDYINIYTDGSCNTKTNIGGWAFIIVNIENIENIENIDAIEEKENIIEYYGFDYNTTNNRMELTAVIKALSLFDREKNIKLHSDSDLIVKSINEGKIKKWEENNWLTKKNNLRSNYDLWKILLKKSSIHKIEFIKVKAHSKNPYNNLCNKLARKAMKKEISNYTEN